jgi:hypothetical protein
MKAAGLSQDCRPSWGFAPRRFDRLFKRSRALAYVFASAAHAVLSFRGAASSNLGRALLSASTAEAAEMELR